MPQLREERPRPPKLIGAGTTRRAASAKRKKYGNAQHHRHAKLSPLYKTQLCSFFPNGSCRDGSRCNYAHGEQDLRNSPDFECTSVCPRLLRDGHCTKPACRYAHQSRELRESPTMLKTKMCKFFLGGLCVVGKACRFAHSRDELKEAAQVQEERVFEWNDRRQEFLGPEQRTRALQQQQLEQREQQRQQLRLTPPIAQQLQSRWWFEEERLQRTEALEHEDVHEPPDLAVPIPPWCYGGGREQSSSNGPRGREERQEPAFYAPSQSIDGNSRADASHPQKALRSRGAVANLGNREHLALDDANSIGGYNDRNLNKDAVTANSVSGIRRVLTSQVSLDSEACHDVKIPDAELVMAMACGIWPFAGIGAVILLQTKERCAIAP